MSSHRQYYPDYSDSLEPQTYWGGKMATAQEIYTPTIPYYTLTCNCSWGEKPKNVRQRAINFKIVGGTPVSDITSFPMMAGLVNPITGCIECGASILTEHHVLTAAHCVFDLNDTHFYLAVGIRHSCITGQQDGQLLHLYSRPIIHEHYNDLFTINDIAIVVTMNRIQFSDRVGPTCLHNQPFFGRGPLRVLGWGRRSEGGPTTLKLNIVDLRVVDLGICKSLLPAYWFTVREDTQICTYGRKKDACEGDSGGPVFWLDPRIGRITQVAVVSIGAGCGRKAPAVNTAVYPFLSWIQDVIHESSNQIYEGIGNRIEGFCQAMPEY